MNTREDSLPIFFQRNFPGTFRGGVLLLDVSVKMGIIDFLQPRIKQKLGENIIVIPQNTGIIFKAVVKFIIFKAVVKLTNIVGPTM